MQSIKQLQEIQTAWKISKTKMMTIVAIFLVFSLGIASGTIVVSAKTPNNTVIANSTVTTSSSLYVGYQVKGPFRLSYSTNTIRIKGSWKVPTANCSVTPNSVSNISVVIDGLDGEGDVMQVGTYQNCVSGVASYGAFANFAPHSTKEKLPTLPIYPNDIIEAQGKWDPSTTSWHAQIINENTSTTQALDSGKASTGFTPAQDSGAFLLSLSSSGKTLTQLSYPISMGKTFTGVKKSDIIGPAHGQITIGQAAAASGFTLVLYQMNSIAPSPLSHDGSGFTIS